MEPGRVILQMTTLAPGSASKSAVIVQGASEIGVMDQNLIHCTKLM